MPTLGVVVPTYNYEERLPSAIKSILDIPGNINLVVIDDGSTDNTLEVLKKLRLDGYKFDYFTQKNSGPATARNHGLNVIADTDYLMFIDADDQACPSEIAECVMVLENNLDIDLLITGHYSLSGDNKKYIPPGLVTNTAEENFRNYLINKKLTMSNGSMLLRSSSVKKYRFPEAFRNSEDIPYFAKILALSTAKHHDMPTVVVNKHADSLRHDITHATNIGVSIADVIFQDSELPEWALKYENDYRVKRCLSLFRTFYNAGNYQQGLNFYRQALRISPRQALKIRQLKRVFKSIFFSIFK